LLKATSEETDETMDNDDDDNDNDELSDLKTHLYLGNNFYYEEKNYDKAIEEYKQVLEEEKDELILIKATYFMAESYVKLGKFGDAKKLFQTLAVNYKQHYLNDSAKKRLEHLSDYLVSENE